MVARLEGAPWQSTSVVTAGLSGSGASSFFDILAGATDWNVEMSVPGYAHAGTTYTLGKTNLCQARAWVPGTFGGYTTLIPPYVGTVTITAIDSSHIAGDFAFVALGSSGVLHVTEGGFDALRDPWSEASTAEEAVAARRRAR